MAARFGGSRFAVRARGSLLEAGFWFDVQVRASCEPREANPRLNQMHQQPIPQLGLEPGRLRWHDPAGIGDRHRDRRSSRDTSRTRLRPCPSRRPARGRRSRARRRRNRCACRSGCRRCRASARARGAAAARRRDRSRGESSSGVAPRQVDGVPAAAEVHRDLALAARRGRAVGDAESLAQRGEERVRRCGPARSLTVRLYGRICIWSCGKATAMNVSASAAAAADLCLQRRAGARRARGAMMPVGDVERRDARKRVYRRTRLGRRRPPDRVLHAVGAVKS